MHTNRNRTVLAIGALTVGGALATVVPTGTSAATTLWKPPTPCLVLRPGPLGGAGFCPGTSAHIDWDLVTRPQDAASAGDTVATSASAATSESTSTTDKTHNPVTVEIVGSPDNPIEDATLRIDVTLSGELASQLDLVDPSHIVVSVTPQTEQATPGNLSEESTHGCPSVPRSADDFVPGSRHMPRC